MSIEASDATWTTRNTSHEEAFSAFSLYLINRILITEICIWKWASWEVVFMGFLKSNLENKINIKSFSKLVLEATGLTTQRWKHRKTCLKQLGKIDLEEPSISWESCSYYIMISQQKTRWGQRQLKTWSRRLNSSNCASSPGARPKRVRCQNLLWTTVQKASQEPPMGVLAKGNFYVMCNWRLIEKYHI